MILPFFAQPDLDFIARTAVGHAAMGTSDIGPVLETLSRCADGDPAGWYAAWHEQADRLHAPFLSVAVVTAVYGLGELVLQFVLGQPTPAGAVAGGVPAALLLNLLMTLPVYALVRRLLPPQQTTDRVREVRLLG